MPKKCTSCQTENPQNARYCRHCGNRFPGWKDEEAKPKTVYRTRTVYEESTPKWMWVALYAGLLAIVFLGIYTYYLERGAYRGTRWFSTVFNHAHPMLTVNGTDSPATLEFARDDEIARVVMVQTPEGYQIKRLPAWTTMTDSTATSFKLKAAVNNGALRSDTCLIVSRSSEVALPIVQQGKAKTPGKAKASSRPKAH